MENYIKITQTDYHDILYILIAIFIGLIIGVEREYNSKAAGLRTIILASVGSCIFTILSAHIGGTTDRIAANVVTGIGFLGAGSIFKEDNKINGITTACTIWITAALGMAAGSGYIYLAILGTLISIAVLWKLSYLEKIIATHNKEIEYRFSFTYFDNCIETLKDDFKKNHLKVNIFYVNKADNTINIHCKAAGNKKHHIEFQKYIFNSSLYNKVEF